ncbi:LptA/OstA family protein [Bradyrhizobium sp. CCBAU 53421]|uniref:LptA/OstA family protein n=1 Tax=Bradyrhizobium sp. CCBAU 53421 TaxID=1325120 RepID=UPI00188C673E|nr:LptA/OstA family protein [Bradyrhizobium sp. CCBAU 53421]QOZ30403.1 LPS ABC transporter substrate-binding protein LptA [Bradyrhizobium sp. CCBAU 53421]
MPMLSRAAIVALFALAAFDTARGQGTASVPNAMQGFAQNRDQPVQIEAAVLEMRDKKKEATFSGNVKVVQGDTTMTSKVLVVFYEDKSTQPPASAPGASAPKAPPPQSATPGPAGASSIKRLEAKGDVVVTQKDQVVTGTTAIFDTKTNLITMLGGSGSQVVLTQCQNVVRGDRLLVDMTTGVSRVESDTGRVQAMVVQGQDCGGAPAPAAPVSLPSASAKPSKSR